MIERRAITRGYRARRGAVAEALADVTVDVKETEFVNLERLRRAPGRFRVRGRVPGAGAS
jgi:hypothetical protein